MARKGGTHPLAARAPRISLAMSIAIGIAIGAAIGMMFDNVALGIGAGIAAVDPALARNKRRPPDDRPG